MPIPEHIAGDASPTIHEEYNALDSMTEGQELSPEDAQAKAELENELEHREAREFIARTTMKKMVAGPDGLMETPEERQRQAAAGQDVSHETRY